MASTPHAIVELPEDVVSVVLVHAFTRHGAKAWMVLRRTCRTFHAASRDALDVESAARCLAMRCPLHLALVGTTACAAVAAMVADSATTTSVRTGMALARGLASVEADARALEVALHVPLHAKRVYGRQTRRPPIKGLHIVLLLVDEVFNTVAGHWRAPVDDSVTSFITAHDDTSRRQCAELTMHLPLEQLNERLCCDETTAHVCASRSRIVLALVDSSARANVMMWSVCPPPRRTMFVARTSTDYVHRLEMSVRLTGMGLCRWWRGDNECRLAFCVRNVEYGAACMQGDRSKDRRYVSLLRTLWEVA